MKTNHGIHTAEGTSADDRALKLFGSLLTRRVRTAAATLLLWAALLIGPMLQKIFFSIVS